MKEMHKSIRVNLIDPTNRKKQILSEIKGKWDECQKHLLETLINSDALVEFNINRYKLQELEYHHLRKITGLNSQYIIDIIKITFAFWKKCNIHKPCNFPLSFNVPRNGDLKYNNEMKPYISVSTFSKMRRINIPIKIDGAWYRLKKYFDEGWETTFFSLYTDGGYYSVFDIKKSFNIMKKYKTVIGVDIGSRTLASISIITSNRKILKQLYFGKDIWEKQRNLSIRYSKLQHHSQKGDEQAKRKIKEFYKNRQFIKTRCYEIAHEIVNLAIKYNSFIVLEDLNDLKYTKLNKKGNRRVKIIPYYQFKKALESVATQNHIDVKSVDSRYTSQICSRCGNIKKVRKVIYRCNKCGYAANRDRNASVNIAHRAVKEFFELFHSEQCPVYDGKCSFQRA